MSYTIRSEPQKKINKIYTEMNKKIAKKSNYTIFLRTNENLLTPFHPQSPHQDSYEKKNSTISKKKQFLRQKLKNSS